MNNCVVVVIMGVRDVWHLYIICHELQVAKKCSRAHKSDSLKLTGKLNSVAGWYPKLTVFFSPVIVSNNNDAQITNHACAIYAFIYYSLLSGLLHVLSLVVGLIHHHYLWQWHSVQLQFHSHLDLYSCCRQHMKAHPLRLRSQISCP